MCGSAAWARQATTNPHPAPNKHPYGGYLRALHDGLPLAGIVECEPTDVRDELEKAAARATVLGVCGGDGTVKAAAEIALRHGMPLAVLPGGTLNHFAYDLGVEGARDLTRAVQQGEAVRVDAGRYSSDGREGVFVNACSLGVYPELVRERERWSRRVSGWPAGVLGPVVKFPSSARRAGRAASGTCDRKAPGRRRGGATSAVRPRGERACQAPRGRREFDDRA